MYPPAYYRARLSEIRNAISGEQDEMKLRLVRNGYLPGLVITDYSRFDNNPLSFLELTTFDTWFALHPEKICGETVVTTSRSFPLKVKGKKEDVIKTVRGSNESLRIRIAKAKLKLLRLKF